MRALNGRAGRDSRAQRPELLESDLCRCNSSGSLNCVAPALNAHHTQKQTLRFEWTLTVSKGETEHKFDLFLLTWGQSTSVTLLNFILLQGRAGVF